MSKTKFKTPMAVTVLRTIAVLWTLAALVDAALLIIGKGQARDFNDWPLLALWGVAIVGLVVAWKWNLLGGIIAIAFTALHDILALILNGSWLPGYMIMWAFIIPPAVLFIIAWVLERNARRKYEAEIKKSRSYYSIRGK